MDALWPTNKAAVMAVRNCPALRATSSKTSSSHPLSAEAKSTISNVYPNGPSAFVKTKIFGQKFGRIVF